MGLRGLFLLDRTKRKTRFGGFFFIFNYLSDFPEATCEGWTTMLVDRDVPFICLFLDDVFYQLTLQRRVSQ